MIRLIPTTLLFSILLVSNQLRAQVNGGENMMAFLRLSQSPHVSALGGVVVINPSSDVMMLTANPSLLREKFHTQLGLNHNFFYAGTRVSNLQYAHHVNSLNTTFGLGIQYLHYGNFRLTDPVGNIYGEASATDYCISLTASRQYTERWRYGASLKFANSRLFDKKARAILMDLGVSYFDTTNRFYFGAAVKNAGVAIQNYEKGVGQPVPLDLQIGIMKKMKKAPFAISVLGQRLLTWDIRYDNPADQSNNQLLFGDTVEKTKTYFADKLFRHFVFAVDINLGKRLEISGGYNHLRRAELGYDERKGMSGFSFGAGLYLNKFTIHYAQSYFHLAGPYQEIGINFQLNKFFGMGEGGNKINWSEKFADKY